MAWTGFNPSTTATLPQLDGNFNILSALVPIPCTVGGLGNDLVLTSTTGAAALTSYANYMQFIGVVVAANTGPMTARVGSLAVLGIYKDTAAGPVALTGAEIKVGNIFILIYDSALASGAGGFHIKSFNL